ncbi:Uncharacterised protein [Enterobacter kobei]|nr:Uncharacterised protein [Enterobacter kobei]
MNTAALLGDLRPRQVNDTFLRVVHHGHPGRYTLAHHRTCRQGAVAVEHFDPVVIFDTQIFGVRFAHPDDWPPARQRQHQQVVAVGGVDTPLLVRRQEVQRLLRVTVRFRAHHRFHGAGVDWRTVNQQAFTEVTHPLVILIQRLTARKRAPWDQLVNVGVSGVIGHMFIFEARPGRAGDNLARLGLNIAEADFLFLFILRQVRVVTTGKLAQGRPRFHRHVAVGFRGQGQDHLCRINCRVQHRLAFRRAVCFGVIELAQQVHFALGVPGDAFTAVTDLLHQRADRGKALVGCRVIAFNRNNVRRGHARDQVALAFFPVLHVQRLRQFGSGVVLDWQRHHVGLFAQVPYTDFREFLRDVFVDFPVAF